MYMSVQPTHTPCDVRVGDENAGFVKIYSHIVSPLAWNIYK
jgi:hypothetical protein